MSKIDNVIVWIMGILLVVLTFTSLFFWNKYEDMKVSYNQLNEVVSEKDEIINKQNKEINKIVESLDQVNAEKDELEDQIFNKMNGDKYKFSIYREEDQTTYTYEGDGTLFGNWTTKSRSLFY